MNDFHTAILNTSRKKIEKNRESLLISFLKELRGYYISERNLDIENRLRHIVKMLTLVFLAVERGTDFNSMDSAFKRRVEMLILKSNSKEIVLINEVAKLVQDSCVAYELERASGEAMNDYLINETFSEIAYLFYVAMWKSLERKFFSFENIIEEALKELKDKTYRANYFDCSV